MCSRYLVSHYLKELISSAGYNKEPDDYRKGRSKRGIHRRQVSRKKGQLTPLPKLSVNLKKRV